MELKTTSKYFIQALNEFRLTTKCDAPLDMEIIRTVLFDWHPSNFITLTASSSNECFIIRDDYFKCFQDLELTEFIITEYSNLRCVKSVKKSIGVFAITISPEKTEYPMNLVNCVKKYTQSKCVKSIYGVFEYGRTRENFHCHFVVSFTDRNGKRNLIDSIKKKYKIYKCEEMGGPVHLLKTLRYFHKAEKLNRGFINRDQCSQFEDIAEGDAPVNFLIDTKEKLFNI